MPTEISGVEEPPTDFTDAHRWLGYVGFSHGIHSKLGCVRGGVRDCVGTAGCHTLLHLCKSVLSVEGHRLLCWCSRDCCTPPLSLHLWEAISKMWVRGYGKMPYPPTRLLCVPCVLWEDTVCFVGAAETAAPPELASVGGYFMNVGAWVWQDAIPSYDATPRGAPR